ncbi:hypothetical protein [Microbacter margulisiae]|uniref:Uncharacterized protein n=1 Tax=Microbacter margulisiae TaxID=1350067 RepID=A0A7W5DRS8_9PORP|nr:hypothetical protein [Microbacter margulisiae]MBB3187885.1 hypothetical protein [Microbacter margulisiae]
MNLKLSFKWLDSFWVGLISGLIMPVVFGLVFYHQAYRGDLSMWEALKLNIQWKLPLFGKLILVSIVPDLGTLFLFYQAEYWKSSRGMIVSTALFFILSFYFLT